MVNGLTEEDVLADIPRAGYDPFAPPQAAPFPELTAEEPDIAPNSSSWMMATLPPPPPEPYVPAGYGASYDEGYAPATGSVATAAPTPGYTPLDALQTVGGYLGYTPPPTAQEKAEAEAQYASTSGLGTVEGFFQDPVAQQESYNFAANLVGAGLRLPGRGSVSGIAGLADDVAPQTATSRLFNIRTPDPGLTSFDDLLNQAKEYTGVGVQADEIATPIMRERQRVQQNVDSQSARLGAVADDIARYFRTDSSGRIPDLPGAPTIQDVAAKLPNYWDSLSPAQREAMFRLQDEVAPFADSLREQGVDLTSRTDVVEGGFYLPRGRADIEGLDAPTKVRSGRGAAGSRKGFERGAVFPSMANGIDAGYQYAAFRDALQAYARDAGNRAIDAWAAGQFKATGLGETAKERLLRQEPALAQKKAALDVELSRLRSLDRSLTTRQTEAIDRFMHDPAFESLDDLRAVLPDTVTRGQNAGDNLDAIREALASVKQQIADLRPGYNRALDRARQTPRDQGVIGFSQLTGTTFPDEIANVANKFLNAEKPASGRGTSVLNAADAFNNLHRMLRATADVSFIGIQGLLGAASHPVAYGRAMSVALRSLGDAKVVGAFVRNFDEQARAAGRPDSRAWAAHGSRFGGIETEFTGGVGLAGKAPRAISNAPVIKQSNRAFGAAGDALRLAVNDAIYKSRTSGGRVLEDADLDEIAKFSNLMTGWASWRVGGDLGALAEFAPRYFASQLDLAARAMFTGGIAGTEARRALGSLIGAGTLLTVAANEARGKETSFIPGTPNFMRIRDVFGLDISVFGPWDSFVRAAVYAGKGDLAYAARSKGSGLVGLSWDYISGESFMGERTRDTPRQAVEHLLRSFAPFGIGDIDRKSPAATVFGAAGVKATDLSLGERVEQGGFKELSTQDQFNAIRMQAWQTVGGQTGQSYYDWSNQKRADALAQAIRDNPSLDPEDDFYALIKKAETIFNADPLEKEFDKAKNEVETEWIRANPKQALEFANQQAREPWSLERWEPTQAQANLIAELNGRTVPFPPKPTATPKTARMEPQLREALPYSGGANETFEQLRSEPFDFPMAGGGFEEDSPYQTLEAVTAPPIEQEVREFVSQNTQEAARAVIQRLVNLSPEGEELLESIPFTANVDTKEWSGLAHMGDSNQIEIARSARRYDRVFPHEMAHIARFNLVDLDAFLSDVEASAGELRDLDERQYKALKALLANGDRADDEHVYIDIAEMYGYDKSAMPERLQQHFGWLQ